MSKVATFTVDSSLPKVAQAASLALVMLRRAKVDKWSDLAADPTPLASMYLTSAQKKLLAEHADVVTLLGYKTPRCTIAVCDTCNEPLIITGAPPAKCSLTLRCEGKYSKIQPGKLELVAADDIDPWTDDEPHETVPPVAEDSPRVEEESVDTTWPDVTGETGSDDQVDDLLDLDSIDEDDLEPF